MRPAVSVVIPVRDQPERLRLCLASYLNQTLAPDRFELIVVDDRSAEDVESEVRALEGRLGVRYLRNDLARGRGFARHLGIRSAAGDIVVCTDGDCLANPAFLECHLAAHQNGERLVASGRLRHLPQFAHTRDPAEGCPGSPDRSRTAQWSAEATHCLTCDDVAEWAPKIEGMAARSNYPDSDAWNIMVEDFLRRISASSEPYAESAWNVLITQNLSVSRRDYDAVGGFEEDVEYADDLVFAYKALHGGLRVRFIPEACTYHLFHAYDPRLRMKEHLRDWRLLYEKFPSFDVKLRDVFALYHRDYRSPLVCPIRDLFDYQRVAEAKTALTPANIDAERARLGLQDLSNNHYWLDREKAVDWLYGHLGESVPRRECEQILRDGEARGMPHRRGPHPGYNDHQLKEWLYSSSSEFYGLDHAPHVSRFRDLQRRHQSSDVSDGLHPVHPVRYTLDYELRYQLPDDGDVDGVLLSMPVPVQRREQPLARPLRLSHPEMARCVELGLGAVYGVHMPREEFGPDGSACFGYQYEITVHELYGRLDASACSITGDAALLERHLDIPDAVLPLERLRRVAQEIAGDEANPLEVARRLYSWVATNVRLSFLPVPEGQYFESVVLDRASNCIPICTVLCGLLRALGIPARMVSGMQVPQFATEPGVFRAQLVGQSGWGHSWVEFHLEPYGWICMEHPWWMGERSLTEQNATDTGELEAAKAELTPFLDRFYFGNMDAYRIYSTPSCWRMPNIILCSAGGERRIERSGMTASIVVSHNGDAGDGA